MKDNQSTPCFILSQLLIVPIDSPPPPRRVPVQSSLVFSLGSGVTPGGNIMPLSYSGLQYQPPAAITAGFARITGSVSVRSGTRVACARRPPPPAPAPLLLLHHQLLQVSTHQKADLDRGRGLKPPSGGILTVAAATRIRTKVTRWPRPRVRLIHLRTIPSRFQDIGCFRPPPPFGALQSLLAMNSWSP